MSASPEATSPLTLAALTALDPDPVSFDALADAPERWHPAIAELAARHSAAPVRQPGQGTVLVGLVGSELVVKLFPPFLHDHFAFERAMLSHLHGRLSLPTPQRVASGSVGRWPYLVMSQLPGSTLDKAWPTFTEIERLQALRTIGRVMAEVHALPVAPVAPLAPAWPAFLQRQRERCAQRQQRTGLPAHLLAQLPAFLAAGPVPAGGEVILTGEYTPFNLLQREGVLSGMFDFGDGLVGPRAYDWLGPLCFLSEGHAARGDALFEGYGRAFDRQRREELLRLLLLHRYSALPLQIKVPGWQQAGSFAELAGLVFP
jgi:hygromycin-B 7''-O-kinase